MSNKEWFAQAKYGMMIHFGLYSILGGEWRGKRVETASEWIQNTLAIPGAEYEGLTKLFNPVYFNAEEWVLSAKEAGMQYMVVTSKHHDGFCLFKSAYDKFNCVDGTPFGRDIMAELAEACYKHNLKLGLYYSQEIDWHEPHGGGYHTDRAPGEWDWTNYWDYPDPTKKDFSLCFESKIKTQFKEILTQYGDLALIWCDTPIDITPEQSMELYNMIKQYQPDCLINSRIGNSVGDYQSCSDNLVSFNAGDECGTGGGNKTGGKAVGERYGLYECPVTTCESWGWKTDCIWKTPEALKAAKDRLNAQGVNYLLNIGPDPLGRLPLTALDILKKMQEL